MTPMPYASSFLSFDVVVIVPVGFFSKEFASFPAPPKKHSTCWWMRLWTALRGGPPWLWLGPWQGSWSSRLDMGPRWWESEVRSVVSQLWVLCDAAASVKMLNLFGWVCEINLPFGSRGSMGCCPANHDIGTWKLNDQRAGGKDQIQKVALPWHISLHFSVPNPLITIAAEKSSLKGQTYILTTLPFVVPFYPFA